MPYSVKEIFKTLQGEGYNTGRTAVFCRFAGCNLWSGREQDRATADCNFCDTDFVDGTKYTSETLINEILLTWGMGEEKRFVVFTGGEPMLQFDETIIKEMLECEFEIALETNGTIEVPESWWADVWICVSPKAYAHLKVLEADEVKLVYPQQGLDPQDVYETISAFHYSLQPMDGPDLEENTQACIAYVLENPQWCLSLQTHKFTGLR